MAEAKKKAAAKKSPAKNTSAKKTAAKKPAVKKAPAKKAAAKKGVSGYGGGSVEVVMSVDQVAKEAASIAANAPKISELDALADDGAFLSINNLRAGYGKMEILHDFSLRVGQGQSLCLIGPNGAGKSTVLHSIFGFTNIFSGSIVIEGQDVNALSARDLRGLRAEKIGMVFQNMALMPHRTVLENAAMPLEVRGVAEAEERVFAGRGPPLLPLERAHAEQRRRGAGDDHQQGEEDEHAEHSAATPRDCATQALEERVGLCEHGLITHVPAHVVGQLLVAGPFLAELSAQMARTFLEER